MHFAQEAITCRAALQVALESGALGGAKLAVGVGRYDDVLRAV
jgi:hypothetical protein